ncbi:MAG: Ig-like domain-containing protein [Nannocystaceae bacterium]
MMRHTPLLLLSIASSLALGGGGDASAAEPARHPISAEAPWALELDDELSKPLVEQWYGPQVAERWQQIEPHWAADGTQLLTRDSFDETMLTTLGVPPVPAKTYDPAPGVVFVAMDGVTLRPNCGNGDSAHAALNCTPLVDSETTFPAFGAQAAAEYQQLRNYYEPFDLVMTSARPPDFLPYTMTVIGGSSQQAGQGGGVCGVANVACDGLKRNHVSLNFPQSCGGMAETAGQETAHNWGLEHTDNPNDILYPFNNGGSKSFIDSCMNISHATGNGITSCGYVHEVYCPAGAGEQQNSYAEMLGVFGPATADTTAPVIVSTSPQDGAVFGTDEELTITATIEEDSRMLGVKWTWLEGLPADTESYTRCTNNVCTTDFVPGPSFDAAEIPWDFLTLDGAPAGTYSFQIEALDAYANYDSEVITIEIVEGGGSAEGGVDESGGAEAGETGDVPGGTGGEGGSGDGTGDSAGADGGGADGGGCRMATPRGGWAAMLGLLLIAGRRRRRAAA